jgi:hypothetical protein
MKNEIRNQQENLPKCFCDECKQEKPALGFTNLTIAEGIPAKQLCSACFNIFAADRMGIAKPEFSEFPPVTLFDSLGKEHTFYFEVRFTTGAGITATELDREGNRGGYEFSVLEHPEIPILELYEQLIEKIKTALSIRYLEVSDFLNKIYIKDDAIVGRIEENKNGPTVIIDGKEFTWTEFGEFLIPFTGFNFRLECMDSCEDMDLSSKINKPEHVWWLDRTKDKDKNKEIH